MTEKNIINFVLSIAICETAGLIGSVFTFSSIPTWYAALVKPPLNPPSWVFGPVWTILYALMGIAAFLIWQKLEKNKKAKESLMLFGLQLTLNTLWSIVFFGLQMPGLAFIIIVMMWLAIAGTIFSFAKISRTAAYLLVPYLIWVSFASYLNFGLWFLNAGAS
ncbi:MAG: TspO/MBR family protein [Candidatus Uhrbacteria bacterium]